MADTALQKAERQLAQAKARLQALKNREATKSRKMDTRRKVILGGALMDLASRDGAAAGMVDRLVRNLPRDQDRATFDGWSFEAGATSVTGGGSDGGDAGGSDAVPAPSAPSSEPAVPAAPAVSALEHGDRA